MSKPAPVDWKIRTARSDDLSAVRLFYASVGYGGGAAEGDCVLIAETNGQIAGACRLCAEEEGLTLRGEYVAADCQRRGIGSALVAAALRRARGRRLYCIPFSHLRDFYARGGFVELSPAQAPAFLAERIGIYREKLGLDVLLMRAG